MTIKMNFPAYIRRFERENTNVLTFGDAIDYDKKIDAISAEFLRYAQEEAQSITQNTNE